MTALDRRAVLKNLLGGAAAAVTAGSIFAPGLAFAAPMPVSTLPAAPQEKLIEEARVVVHHHHHHHRHGWHGHRHRRHTCWWHRGRRICGWR